ncbi:MAG: Hsp33 family molecular chaperone HslO [Lachnospiraceae bacterium]|nr:Hsp33 family molecular chaperone HslO [Lachnospiraceae bacterium]
MDYIVRAMAANGQIRAFAATTRELTEFARSAHNTSPIVTAALGRLLTAGAMMGVMMKGEEDVLTLRIQCSGPIQGLLVTADSKGKVKGYANCPDVMLPPREDGHLDVGGALGLGVLSVIKDMGLKEPYVGDTALQTGEIAEDLTYYFATSEQVPSAVGLGVLMNRENTVRQAGGFIVQLMPFAEEATISALEEKIQKISSVTEMLESGKTPEDILQELLGGLGLEITDTVPTRFACDCSKERFEKGLLCIGKKELSDLLSEEKPVETVCHFCGRKYAFSVEELRRIARK